MTYIRSRSILTGTVALVALLIVTAPAFAQASPDARTVAEQINAANNLLRAGNVDEAIEGYRGVVPSDNQRHQLNYNLAVAEYRKGNIKAAEELFTDVAGTGSAEIAADSRYNLGNCQYAAALQIAEQDRSAAIERLRHAIANYRSAVRANRNAADARANIELAGELIRRLEEKQKQEEQQQAQQQNQSQDSESQQEQSSSDGKQPPTGSQDSGSEKPQEKNQPDEDTPDGQQQRQPSGEGQPAKDEQQPDEKSGAAGEPESNRQTSTEPSRPPQVSEEQSLSPRQTQQPSGDQPSANEEAASDPQQAKQQPVPTGDLKAAGESDQNQTPVDSIRRDDQNAKDGLMTYEEALKMLQAVRDRNMLRRLQQERRERSRRVPVEKDW